MTATIIVGIRATRPEFGVYLTNLTYCLEAIAKQTVAVEKIVVDLGSTPHYAKRIEEICSGKVDKLLKVESPIWNRSKALNAGIQAATKEIILIVDADCVIPPNYAEAHLQAHSGRGDLCTYSLVYDTFGAIEKSANYAGLLEQTGNLKPLREDGLSHIGIKRGWFIKHGLYNEAYRGWGAEDDSLWNRIRKSGVTPTGIPTFPVHLWHPPYGTILAYIGKFRDYASIVATNRKRYFKEVGK